MALKKIIFWLLILINNVFALLFVGIAFLASPGGADERVSTTGISNFARYFVYVTAVSLIFAGITLLILYLFRKPFGFSRGMLFRFSLIDLAFLLVVSFSIFLYVFVL